jgi:AcrR family transcriptional regulator
LVFKHFATKTALYDAILECCREHDPHFDRLLNLPPTTATVAEIVRFVTEHFIALTDEDDRARHRLFIRSLLEDGEFARVGLRAFAGALLPAFSAAYERAREVGDLAPEAPDATTAFWCVAQFQLMAGSLALPGLATEFTPPVDQLVRAMLRGIGLIDEAIARFVSALPEAAE